MRLHSTELTFDAMWEELKSQSDEARETLEKAEELANVRKGKSMRTTESVAIGERIKMVRQRLGLSQKEFGELLGEWGITNRKGDVKGKEEAVIASWESGRNRAPNKVLKAIHDHAVIDGCYIKWEYLTAEESGMLEEKRHSIREFTTDELLAELKRRTEAP